ncbi:unnamed protein product [Parnassius mnemosyne]|uniref:AAA+ ATPase domain-containing protein n=1 Tax=Parnassius mnemosyne TaxID=213953 RepID=A0AAV1KVJ5_9NEOP
MCDYPDPDEEYELMYSDEFELMREIEDKTDLNPIKNKPLPAKRSLDFSNHNANNLSNEKDDKKVSEKKDDAISLTPSLQNMEDVLIPSTNSSTKRTAEDLFGDIGDIDFDSIELPSKRQKTEEETDMDLINKILEGRRLKQMLLEPTNRVKVDKKVNFDVKKNISINIPRWSFVPITNSNGDRLYIRLESEDSWDKSLDINTGQLSLRATYASAWEEAHKILEKKEQERVQKEEEVSEVAPHGENQSAMLWVEKYRPHSYLDLLSEEPVNRALLHWLHLWDKVVFKKDVKMKDPQQRNSFSKRAGQFQLTNKWKGKKESEPEIDEDGRPHHKVALLCGPPGVGKTTLAHLLARLAGYRPVELNASDERSAEAFRNALVSATSMRSVLDAEKRPNCLILDEIDGAPVQTVELLVKWCTTTLTEGNKKKSKSQPLRRPVIAICNDLYATSLRPLRPVALIVTVGCVTVARLASRLVAVASCERLKVDSRVLSALAARACGDIRMALHVLSFLRSKSQLTIQDIENVAIGTKDTSKSMMQALQAVFTLEDGKSNDILRTIQAAGEYDRLIEGIFENYLTARVDSRLLIACETMSWLLFYDTVHSWTMRNQNYSLYGTLPLCIARCHRLLASRAQHKLKFPMQGQEMSRRKTELDSIVLSVWRGSSPNVVVNRNVLRLDVLPLLPYLLSPTLRSANIQLCSESERQTVRVCAGAMCDYGLQFIQQRTPEGLYAFVLEPDIHKVAFFGNEERVRTQPAIRQAIAREQQLEMIRRNEEMAGRVNPRKNNEATKNKSEENTGEFNSTDGTESRLPNHLQRLQPKAVVKSTPQLHKDFFGRIVPTAQAHRQEAIPDVISSSGVFYQYREGFNNAVRRNVRLRDLL